MPEYKGSRVRRAPTPSKQKRLALPAAVYSIIVIVLSLIQLGIGASIALDSSFLIISLIPVWLINRDDIWAGDVLYFSFSLYCGGMSLIFKTLLLQPLQTNLVEPSLSALYIFISFISVTIFYIFVRIARRRPNRIRKVLESTFNEGPFLIYFARLFFIIGFLTQILATIFRPHLENGALEQGEGTGAFGAFYFMMLFGMAAQVGVLNIKRKSILERTILLLMLTCVFAVSILGNIKKPIFDAILIFVLAIYSFRIRMKPWVYASLIGGAVAMQLFVSPLIHVVRAEGAMTPAERIQSTMQILEQNDYDFGKINRLYDIKAAAMGEYRADSSYYYPSTLNLDRFSLILPTDQVVRSGNPGQTPLGEQTQLMITQILPGFTTQHLNYVGADEIAWFYNIRNWGVIGRPVIGMPASSYAIGGWVAALFLPGAVYGLFFWLIDNFFGTIRNSILGLGCAAYVGQYAEKEYDAMLEILVREMVFMYAVFFVVIVAYRLAVQRRQSAITATRMVTQAKRTPLTGGRFGPVAKSLIGADYGGFVVAVDAGGVRGLVSDVSETEAPPASTDGAKKKRSRKKKVEGEVATNAVQPQASEPETLAPESDPDVSNVPQQKPKRARRRAKD